MNIRDAIERQRQECLERANKLGEAYALADRLSELEAAAAEVRKQLKALGLDVAGDNKQKPSKGWAKTYIADALAEALKDGPMKIMDICAALRMSGLKTKAANDKNLATSVAQTVKKDGRFKRIERGVYAMNSYIPV